MGLTVLVVDDDPNTVQMLEDSVPWENYGVSQIYSAYQGYQALDIIRENVPDIVISDIEMPQMDGLEMMKQLSQASNRPEIICLTCHDNFDYARQAIIYGVSAYLLKPFRLDEFSGVLLKTIVRCQKKMENQKLMRELENNRRQFEKNQDYLVQNLIFRLLNKSIEGNTQQLTELAQNRNIPFAVCEKYYLLYVGVNLNNGGVENISESEFYFIFQNLAKEIIYGDVSAPYVVENKLPPYYILMMPVPEKNGDREKMKKCCERLITISQEYLNIHITCAVSTSGYPEKFGEIKDDMDHLFLREGMNQGKVILMNDESSHQKMEEESFRIDEASKMLEERNKTELLTLLLNHLQQLESKGNLNAIYMQAVHHSIMQLFYGFLLENNIQAYELFKNETFLELNEKAEYSIRNMVRYCSYLYDTTYEQIEFLKQEDSVVARIKKYIEQHYKENISREEIAASIFITPNYLSKIFHEKAGITLREYINICRIEEAKHLMTTTDYSVTEIALMTGFENISYFSTVFKRYSGETPAAWKNKLLQKNNS